MGNTQRQINDPSLYQMAPPPRQTYFDELLTNRIILMDQNSSNSVGFTYTSAIKLGNLLDQKDEYKEIINKQDQTIKELMKRLEEVETQVKYMPNGLGFYEAKENFEEKEKTLKHYPQIPQN